MELQNSNIGFEGAGLWVQSKLTLDATLIHSNSFTSFLIIKFAVASISVTLSPIDILRRQDEPVVHVKT